MRRVLHPVIVAVSAVAVALAGPMGAGFATPAGETPASESTASETSAGETPSTPAIEAARDRAEAAREELDSLATELSLLVEEYHVVEGEVEILEERLAEITDELAAARAEEAHAGRILSERAAEIYKRGPDAGLLGLLLETGSFSDLVTRLEWFALTIRSDAAVLDRLEAARGRVASARAALEARQDEQRTLARELEGRSRAIRRTVAEQEAYVASLDAEVAGLIEQERERQRRLEEERARQAAEEAARRAEAERRAAEEAAARAGEEREGRSGGVDASQPRTEAGDGRPEVVALALEHLGVPYAWGGDSPEEGFDCSGLTWYVYRRAGVDLPRNSAAQFQAGERVLPFDASALEMGDLVFFGYEGDPNRVHHVGIYCGGGDFIHAPSTGDVVKVSSLAERIESRGDYVGACRF